MPGSNFINRPLLALANRYGTLIGHELRTLGFAGGLAGGGSAGA